MNWILFAFALELGAINDTELPVDLTAYVQMESTAILFRHLEIGGILRSYQIPAGGYQWEPLRMDYTVLAIVRFGILSFGAEHICYHPVGTKQVPFVDWNSSDRIFIRVATPYGM